MVLHVLSDFIDLVREADYLQSQMYLAVEYGEFQQGIVTATNEIFKVDKEEALLQLDKKEQNSSISQKCLECGLLEAMVQQANLEFLTEGPQAAMAYLKKRREELPIEYDGKRGLCSYSFLNIANNQIAVYELVKRITDGSSIGLEDRRQNWQNIEPQKCAEDLSSLSNPYRLSILKLLKINQRSFSELSEITGLRTGHLQFHLRTLMEKDLVKKEGRGIYELNYKGSIALSHLADFEKSMSFLEKQGK